MQSRRSPSEVQYKIVTLAGTFSATPVTKQINAVHD
jgi:hypothetical protein